MQRAEGTFEVVNIRGLHARAASKLVQLVSGFKSEVEASRDEEAANAKSVMGMLLLCGAQGSQLRFVATGSDAERVISEIGALIANKFDEGE